jgi:hypothetical protein
MSGESTLTVLLDESGAPVSASYASCKKTLRMTALRDTNSTNPSAALEFYDGESSILRVTADLSELKPDNEKVSFTSVSFTGEGFQSQMVMEEDSKLAGVTIVGSDDVAHESALDFSGWPLIVSDGPVPGPVIPAGIEDLLKPFEPVLLMWVDAQARRTGSSFATWSGLPWAGQHTTPFSVQSSTDSLCGTSCDIASAMAGAACCMWACPTTACFGCVLCAGIAVEADVICHHVVCHE